ncbi:MAG TPA: RhuM family protein [Parvibaculum sp.]
MTEEPTNEPVHLIEDADTGAKFLIYGTSQGISVELRYEGDTFWATQAQIAEMFGIDVRTVSYHLRNILTEGELAGDSVIQESWITASDGKKYRTNIHNLDVILSIGYRVNSKLGTMFRQWATQKLVQFATKGFVIDAERLKKAESQDRLAELREIIRDIRSDEANIYRELRSICAMCQDYDGDSETWRQFYKQTQAKLMHAVTSQTPSEIIASRADASAPDMGLQTWPNERIRKQDVTVSKNYLSSTEIKELNRLTTILLDIFEDQMDIGKLTTMVQAANLLDQQLKSLNRVVLRGGGRISTDKAKALAEKEYGLFDKKRREIRHAEADAQLAALKAANKSLGRSSKNKKP